MPELERPSLDRRALGLALTRLANVKASDALCARVEPETRARRIGITGAPGAGKSTLAGRLALHRSKHSRLGVLAIDPTSPKSGGAILGDRIRMDDLAGSENLYIRSFGSRSASDGLTDNLPELLDTMDAFGFDEVILETVGVGQAEQAARTQVDTLILVLPPDAGDVVQAMKAGIMELADIYAVSKADMPSAMKMATEVKRIVALMHRRFDGWVPPVVLTSHSDSDSVTRLSEQVDRHFEWLVSTGQHGSQTHERQKYRLRRFFERRIQETLNRASLSFFEMPLSEQVEQVIATLGKVDRK
jgi:LAO/AO transport system kinase